MSLVPLRHVTLIGLLADKPAILGILQTLGCCELVPADAADTQARASEPSRGASPEARRALAFLLDSPWQRRRRSASRGGFDAAKVQARALELEQRLRSLRDERDLLSVKVRNLAPWGSFEFPPLEQLAGQRLWFYQVPHYKRRAIPAELVHELVHADDRFAYVVVIAPDEPSGMPVPRTHTGAVSRATLLDRLDAIEAEIDEIQAERAVLTRDAELLAASLASLDDAAERRAAERLTHDDAPLFALAMWVPVDRVDELRAGLAELAPVLRVREPGPTDNPPTLLHASDTLAGAQSLVTFYTTPGYFTWDPSVVVLLAFAAMFAMIVADAGYGLLFALACVPAWRGLSKGVRVVVGSVIAATIAYGVLVGCYFGVEPEPTTLLGRLRALDATEPRSMMAISVVIGVVHLVVANGANALRLRSSASLAPIGWILVLLGGLLAGASVTGYLSGFTTIGLSGVATGLVLVAGFSATQVGVAARVRTGLMALTKLTAAFGDVLSYLRLFALGLASGALAAAFNDLAAQSRDALGGVGIAVAGVVLLVGHGLNLVLALISGAVHGLRLNYIEFFGWGLPDEGRPFRAFRRKEIVGWKPSS